MRIEQSVEVDAPLDQVWALVNDVPRVAPCMPGGALTKVVDERTYEGTVLVKLGPIRMSYKGTVVLEQVDEANHSAVLHARGRDVKGSGTAAANVTTSLEPDGDNRTRLHVSSDVQLTGKVASFGRGAVQDVAGKLFGQFADCLKDTLDAEQAGKPPATPTEPGKPPGTEPPSEAPSAPPPGGGTGEESEPARPGSPPATPTEPGRPAEPRVDRPAGPRGGRPAGLDDTPPWPGAEAAPAATRARAQPRESAPLEVGGLVGTVVAGRLRVAAEFLSAFARGLYLRLTRRA
jgi:uncharacterized protein